jgi:hypothetical protein
VSCDESCVMLTNDTFRVLLFQVASLKLREKAASSVNFGAADKLAAHGY